MERKLNLVSTYELPYDTQKVQASSTFLNACYKKHLLKNEFTFRFFIFVAD